jgi:RNA-dependent RNA polymerase
VQGRIAGAKGMWVLHPDPEYQIANGLPKIWICSSQNKVNLGPLHGLGSAHQIFDLIALSHVTGPTSWLSSQTLVNLTHNGVSTDLLKELMVIGFMTKFVS